MALDQNYQNPNDPKQILEEIQNLPPNASMKTIQDALLKINTYERTPNLLNDLVTKNVLKFPTIVTIVKHYKANEIGDIAPGKEPQIVSLFTRQIIISQRSVDDFFEWLETTTFSNHETESVIQPKSRLPQNPTTETAAELSRAALKGLEPLPQEKTGLRAWLQRTLPSIFKDT